MAVDITRLGDPDLIPPAEVSRPIAATLPAGALAEVGLGSLDVPGLPATWALTAAAVFEVDGSLAAAAPGCDGPVVSLTYRDLAGVGDRELGLAVQSPTCSLIDQGRIGTGAGEGESVTAGRFSGSADPSGAGLTVGDVSDGTTSVRFTTDLPIEDAAEAIASLAPVARPPTG